MSCSRLVRPGEFQFEAHLLLFATNHQVVWPNFPADLMALYELNHD
jgi:hypothetical protein